MRKAEEWVLGLDLVGDPAQAIKVIRRIQADAIRYAANMEGDIKNVFLLNLADELEKSN